MLGQEKPEQHETRRPINRLCYPPVGPLRGVGRPVVPLLSHHRLALRRSGAPPPPRLHTSTVR